MSIEYLKISPQEAIAKLDILVLDGYRFLDEIEKEHFTSQKNGTYDAHMNIAWQKDIDHWAQKCLNELQEIFIPMRFAYTFKYAASDSIAKQDANDGYEIMLMRFHKRIQTLADFIDFIFVRGNISITNKPSEDTVRQ